jgi:glucose/arabinose dehydrogenase
VDEAARNGRHASNRARAFGCQTARKPDVSLRHKQAGMDEPLLFRAPTDIGISGMAFYTGDRFPAWKGSVFVGGMASARRLERLVFNAKGLPIRDEALLGELKQRIRDVRQWPDGLLYVLTDEEAGALLRIEPVQ